MTELIVTLEASFDAPAGPAGTDDVVEQYNASESLPTEHSHKWASVFGELHRVRQLHDDWDGEGSPAPGSELVDSAVLLAQNLSQYEAPPCRVHAGINGTIFFEWHSQAGYREVEVVAPGKADCREVNGGSASAKPLSFTR